MGAIEQQVGKMAAERYGSLARFARQAGINYHTLSSILSRGSFANARNENVRAIASALELDPDQLVKGTLAPTQASQNGFKQVPVTRGLDAGATTNSLLPQASAPVPADLVEQHPDSFLLHVPDTGVNRIIPQDAYALVVPGNAIEHAGQPHAVRIDGSDAVIRRAYPLANGLRLEPDSTDPTWHQAIYDFADPETPPLQVIGRVIWYTLPTTWRF